MSKDSEVNLIDQKLSAASQPQGISRRELLSAAALVSIPAGSNAASAWSNSAEYFPPPDSEGGWRTLKTTSEIRKRAGMDMSRLDQAWEFTQRCCQNAGLCVVRH